MVKASKTTCFWSFVKTIDKVPNLYFGYRINNIKPKNYEQVDHNVETFYVPPNYSKFEINKIKLH